MSGHGSRWFSYKMYNWHPLQLKKLKSWELFWSYQQTAWPIWQFWPNFEVNGLDWQFCLAGSSKTVPRIFIFLIVLCAEYLLDVKSIETHAHTFFKVNFFYRHCVCVYFLVYLALLVYLAPESTEIGIRKMEGG